jgi:CubicO group peptidase (beta-lactamase class C family)
MKISFRFIVAALGLMFISSLHAQLLQPYALANAVAAKMDGTRLARIDSLVQQYVDSQWIAGATLLFARDGKIFYQKAIGYSDMGKKTPIKNDAIFRIASQTKAITSVAVMMLLEEGKFLLDDRVSKYLPSFAKPQVLDTFNPADSSYTTVPAKSEITIRQLLMHTSGIGYATIGSKEANAIYGKQDITWGIGVFPGRIMAHDMEKLGRLPLMHQPGEKFTYGLNTDVLSYLIEKVSGIPLDVFFKQRIFDRLGMKDTWFYLPKDKQARLVKLHIDKRGSMEVAGETYERNGTFLSDHANTQGTYFAGGGGLVSTAYDYSIFLEMLRNGGLYNGQRIVSRNSVRMMTTNQIGDIDRGPNEKFGLGFGIITPQGSVRTGLPEGSFVWGGAFSSTYWVDPTHNIVGQIMVNQYPNSHPDLNDKIKILLYSSLME